MEIHRIKQEADLREWLAENVIAWNKTPGRPHIKHVWIEPGFGGSIGVSDAQLTIRGIDYGVELKHLLTTSKGVCYKIRPVQRRYNVMGVRTGSKLVILATIAMSNRNDLVLIRGDNCPLRDYCDALDRKGKDVIIAGDRPFEAFIRTITNPNYWPSEDDYTIAQLPLKREQDQ